MCLWWDLLTCLAGPVKPVKSHSHGDHTGTDPGTPWLTKGKLNEAEGARLHLKLFKNLFSFQIFLSGPIENILV